MHMDYELKFDPSIASRSDLLEKLKRLEPALRETCGGGLEMKINAN